MGDRLETGIELLDRLEHDELSLAEVLDRVETVTSSPGLQREILDVAEQRGIVEREGATIEPRSEGNYVDFERDVVVRQGDFSCRRCGSGLSEGHFVRLDAGEVGPFGSTCIKKVLGRV